MFIKHYAPNRCEPSIEVIVKMGVRPEGGGLLGHPKTKKMLIFRFVGIFEYIILLNMLILFLDMCQNSLGWMPSL